MMPNLKEEYREVLWKRLHTLREQGLSLDMTRGNPCPEQLALSGSMLSVRGTHASDGTDCRNYGGDLLGIPEARIFAAQYLGTSPKQTLVSGTSSLALMHDVIVQRLLSVIGWTDHRIERKSFLCPVPGYDRHFEILSRYDIGMVPVGIGKNGPDMVAVREAVKDPQVVGMWLMPKYSNPTGVTCTPEVIRELASMEVANPGFTVMVDDAYRHHDFTSHPDRPLDCLGIARQSGAEDRFFVFGSLSKVTFAGAGLAMMATSPGNLEWFSRSLRVQSIGPDKLNQLRHVHFLHNMRGVKIHMKRHRRIVEPKFRVVYDTLNGHIGGKGIATWTQPKGGYFVSLYLTHGSAKRLVELAGSAGVKLTPAGAGFTQGRDPNDKHLRLAPTFPSLEELRRAMEVVAVAAEITHREKHPW